MHLYPLISEFYFPLTGKLKSNCFRFSLKSNNTAHYLSGTITYAKDEVGKKVATYPIKYFLADNNSPKKSGGNGVSVSEKSKMDEYNDLVRDLGIGWIPKLGNW